MNMPCRAEREQHRQQMATLWARNADGQGGEGDDSENEREIARQQQQQQQQQAEAMALFMKKKPSNTRRHLGPTLDDIAIIRAQTAPSKNTLLAAKKSAESATATATATASESENENDDDSRDPDAPTQVIQFCFLEKWHIMQ